MLPRSDTSRACADHRLHISEKFPNRVDGTAIREPQNFRIGNALASGRKQPIISPTERRRDISEEFTDMDILLQHRRYCHVIAGSDGLADFPVRDNIRTIPACVPQSPGSAVPESLCIAWE